jgi:hypothetical protein
MQIGKVGVGYVCYAPGAKSMTLQLNGDKKKYQACWINPRNGKLVGETFSIKATSSVELENKGILWLYR